MDRNIYIYIYIFISTRRLHHSPLISIIMIMGMMSCFWNSFSHDCVSHLRVLVCTHSYTSFTTRLHHYEDDHFLYLAKFCFKFLHDFCPLKSNFLCLSLHIHHAPPISIIMEMIFCSFPSFFLFLIIPFFPYRFFSHFWVTVLVFISLSTSFTSHFHHDGKRNIPLIILSFSHVFPLSYLSHGFQVGVYTSSSFTTHLYTFFFPSSLFLFLMFVYESLCYRALLQKTPIFRRSVLIECQRTLCLHRSLSMCTRTHAWFLSLGTPLSTVQNREVDSFFWIFFFGTMELLFPYYTSVLSRAHVFALSLCVRSVALCSLCRSLALALAPLRLFSLSCVLSCILLHLLSF